MSTRFYFAPVDAPDISPATSASWESFATSYYGATLRGKLKYDPLSKSSWYEFITSSKSTSSTSYDMGGGQFISDPLPTDGVLSGTMTVVIPAYESLATDDDYLQVIVRVLNSTGMTVRGTAYAGQTATSVVTTKGANNEELGAGSASMLSRIISAVALTTVNYLAGDRIVVEVGVRSTAAATASFADIALHDSEDSIGDMPLLSGININDLSISSPAFSIRPWIEFSANLLPALNTEEYKFLNNGIILNSKATIPFVDITSVDGVDSADVRTQTHDREGIHGGYVSAEFESLRTLTINGVIYASPVGFDAFMDRLKANFAPTRRDHPFYMMTDAGLRVIYGKSLGLKYSKDQMRRLGKANFQVQLLCADPRWYTPDEIRVTLTNSSTDPNVNFTSLGNRDTPTKIYVTNMSIVGADRAYIYLYNVDGLVTYDLVNVVATTSDILILDLDRRTASLNWTKNVLGSINISGQWHGVTGGINKFTLSSHLGTFDATLVYKDAWR